MTKLFKWMFLPALLLFTPPARSQESYPVTHSDRPVFGVHLMPLSLLNLRGRYRLGAVLQYHRMSYVLDLSYGDRNTPKLIYKNEDMVLFWGIRPEVRYRLFNSSRPDLSGRDTYVGIEVPITWMERILYERSYEATDGQRYSYGSAREIRRRATMVLKVGQVLFKNQHWYTDMYGGVGIGIRTVAYTEVTGKIKGDGIYYTPSDYAYRWDTDAEGHTLTYDLSLGFRMGYAF